jgi:hypothetical protein
MANPSTNTIILDGKRVAYSTTTKFLVQVGLGAKGAYKTRYSFTGNLTQALMYYKSINIGRGYKKRLIAPSMNRPLLARAFS